LERTVRVDLGERSYPVRIGMDILTKAGPEIARRTGATHAVVITVPPVGRRYAGRLLRSLREAGIRARRLEVPDGDRSKNLRQVARLYDALLEMGADRGSVVVALGGGMVGDLAGFVAATFLRGIPFVQVPTTLLAMVDASTGGKVGVNLRQGKNLVGAFYQPRLVFVDAATLRTLPRRDRAAGLAEVIKAAAIWDPDLFEELERNVERVLDLDSEVLLPVLERAVAIKAEVVSRDEREEGLRMLLNFGHTLAHAVEALARYRGVLHGEAVAMGMAFAARRSESLGLAPSGTAERLVALLERAGLPTELPDHPRRAYLEALRVDKKRRDARIRFVALRRIGMAETVPLLPGQILPASRARPRRGANR
jgi:3-dehydroquinate synthase